MTCYGAEWTGSKCDGEDKQASAPPSDLVTNQITDTLCSECYRKACWKQGSLMQYGIPVTERGRIFFFQEGFPKEWKLDGRGAGCSTKRKQRPGQGPGWKRSAQFGNYMNFYVKVGTFERSSKLPLRAIICEQVEEPARVLLNKHAETADAKYPEQELRLVYSAKGAYKSKLWLEARPSVTGGTKPSATLVQQSLHDHAPVQRPSLGSAAASPAPCSGNASSRKSPRLGEAGPSNALSPMSSVDELDVSCFLNSPTGGE